MKRLATFIATSLFVLCGPQIVHAADASAKPSILDLIRQYKGELAEKNTSGKQDVAAVAQPSLTQAVKQLIAKGASVNPDRDGVRTPLMQAVFTDQDALVELLLKNGAKVNARDEDGETALMFAAFNARPAVVRMLLQHGANVNILSTGSQPLSPLELFIMNPEEENAVQGQIACIRLLVAGGAKLQAYGQAYRGQPPLTPLMIASSKRNRPGLVAALIELGADVHAVDKNHANALFYAAQFGLADVAKVLLDMGARADIRTTYWDWTPLRAAIESHDEETALLLLEHSTLATVNIRATLNIGGQPMPFHGAPTSTTALFHAIQEKMLTLVPKLLTKGANVNEPGHVEGLTPLSYAAARRQTKIVQLLLENGANVDATNADQDGDTPLMYAAGYGPNPKMLELLIQRGAKVNAKNRNGLTALDQARRSGGPTAEENVAVLLKHGAVGGPVRKEICCQRH